MDEERQSELVEIRILTGEAESHKLPAHRMPFAVSKKWHIS